MARTMNFLSEHGFASPEEVDAALETAISGQHAAGEKLKELETDLKELMSKANSRSYAALCRQYRETIKEIEEILERLNR